MRGACAKPDFSAAKRRVLTEMQPYVITVDDSLGSTATTPTAAAVSEGGGEDGYRTVLEIIACSTYVHRSRVRTDPRKPLKTLELRNRV